MRTAPGYRGTGLLWPCWDGGWRLSSSVTVGRGTH